MAAWLQSGWFWLGVVIVGVLAVRIGVELRRRWDYARRVSGKSKHEVTMSETEYASLREQQRPNPSMEQEKAMLDLRRTQNTLSR